MYDSRPIDDATQQTIIARLRALPSDDVAMFWRAFMVTRVRDFHRGTLVAVRQVLSNIEKQRGIR